MNNMKKTNLLKGNLRLLMLIASLFCGNLFAQTSAIYNLRSDTVDVLHYEVNLNITDFAGKSIAGNTKIKMSPKMFSVNSVSFDLLSLTVDSVMYNGVALTFLYNSPLLVAYFSSPILDADTIDVIVYYRGMPVTDPTWGGFYWQSGYAYNLGVGFTSIPHNFGRTFHPCFDNFTERATYTFNISTSGSKIAYCNGVLTNVDTTGGLTTRTWVMNDPIPSYLVCISVNSYTHVNQKYISTLTGDTTPVMLASLPADTTNFKGSFSNLFSAVNTFEQNYGPFEWDKIGYVAVPFSSGAMEHATMISYPKATLTGSTTYQNLMAHELSHHWWGDLVTCETAEDMWISEGMARWSEALFYETLSGYSGYLNNIRPNHKQVLWKAYVDDGGWWPLSGMPQSVTYGTTTYNKGADVIHTMRGYLGDSLFFLGLKTIIANNKFKTLNASQYRDWMNSVSGINVTDFFDDWIFQPGYPEFAIDSIVAIPDGANFDITVYSKQKLRSATHLANNVPIQIMFRNNLFEYYSDKVTLSGLTQVSTVQDVPFIPDVAYFNDNEKISEAVTAQQGLFTSTGIKTYTNANFNFNVQTIGDTVWARAEHHWVAADTFKVNNFLYTISPDRFWRIYLLGDVTNLYVKGSVAYNGTTSASGYLDVGLMSVLTTGFNEDSLRLFYRKNASENWRVYTACTFSIGGATDKFGSISIDTLIAGDFALGIKSGSLNVNHIEKENSFDLFPNPTAGDFTIELKSKSAKINSYYVHDTYGNLILTGNISSSKTVIPTTGFENGTYFVSLVAANKIVATKKMIFHK